MTEQQTGVYDTSGGRCTAALSIKGEVFRCILATEHDGWAHQSVDADALWDDGSPGRFEEEDR